VAPSYSVVIPARDAEHSLGSVLQALAGQVPAPLEVIVVDDGSTDATAAIARGNGARVIEPPGARSSAGGARNAGWEVAGGDVVVFLDADAVPSADWGAGVVRAARELPGALIGCARTFHSSTAWGWVAHLQVETPYLPRGGPRDVAFVSSFCMLVPRDAPLLWDESYGGEDALFCVDALAAGLRLVFDPRFTADHDHDRQSFADLRSQQRRLAYGLARAGAIQREGRHRRVLSRLPLHYFLLARLPVIYRRLDDDAGLRRRFRSLLPRIIVAEWTLGLSALRYVIHRPPLRTPA
jgi:glycosyltransferase involved in cell wall biosynthesis